ncbi:MULTISPECIES: hypothetical protein [Bacillaceae]|jgi:hypothetical protein|nr:MULTISPECIES: hypothetical protein [Bacillaceae]MCM3055233.1 hypothetical protein [Caldibacillus thermoamylovorans]MCM3478918.1 hypothetical protein [Caldibacillus thermoamylovorans]
MHKKIFKFRDSLMPFINFNQFLCSLFVPLLKTKNSKERKNNTLDKLTKSFTPSFTSFNPTKMSTADKTPVTTKMIKKNKYIQLPLLLKKENFFALDETKEIVN